MRNIAFCKKNVYLRDLLSVIRRNILRVFLFGRKNYQQKESIAFTRDRFD